MAEEKKDFAVEDSQVTENSGLSPPIEKRTKKDKNVLKNGKNRKLEKEKDFLPSDLQHLRDKLDKKEMSFLHNLTTKRYTKKVTHGILLERLITISLILILLTMGVVYSVSYTYVNSGYGINVVSNQLITKAVSLTEDENFENLTVGLKASAVTEMDNISYDWLPSNLDELGGGSHNGDNYICYTFYVLNTGNADLDYYSSLSVRNSTQNVETAIRIMIYFNGTPTVYTHTYEEKIDGVIENTYGVSVEEFYSEEILVHNTVNLSIGSYDRYTVVVWLEGEDVDCVNDKFSSELQLIWNIDVVPD